MKRLLTAFLIALIPSLVLAQGSGTPANLRVLTDANGYLVVAGASQTAPVTQSTFSQTRLSTDANGYLQVIVVGGPIAPDSICLDGTNQDVCLHRNAANYLGLRNGVNPQAFSIAATDDNTNYERLVLSSSGVGSPFYIETEKGGTGGNTNLYIQSEGSQILFSTADTLAQGWQITSGNFLATTDNLYNIGASGATRPQYIYVSKTLFSEYSGIGTTTTAGLTLQNLTVAAAGAQQYSPGLSQIGYGWKTDATAASQPVEVRWELRPVQGAVSPSYNYILMGRVNVGSWSDHLTITSQGNLTPGSNVVLGDTRGLYWFSRGSWSSSADGAYTLNNNGFTANLAVGLSATGGAKLASHAISLAQDATTLIAAAPVGILTVTNTTDSNVCTFSLIGTGVVAEITDATGGCSATKDNAATVNVYYDTDGVYVQNKITAIKSVRLVLNGV